MARDTRRSRLKSQISTNEELPVFSEAQIGTFNSGYVDSLDEALAVLDEDVIPPEGQTKSFTGNEE